MSYSKEAPKPLISDRAVGEMLQKIALNPDGSPMPTRVDEAQPSRYELVGTFAEQSMNGFRQLNRPFAEKLRKAIGSSGQGVETRRSFGPGVIIGIFAHAVELGSDYLETIGNIPEEKLENIENQVNLVRNGVRKRNPADYAINDWEFPPQETHIKHFAESAASQSYAEFHRHIFELGVLAGFRIGKTIRQPEIDASQPKAESLNFNEFAQIVPLINEDTVNDILLQIGITGKSEPGYVLQDEMMRRFNRYNQAIGYSVGVFGKFKAINKPLFDALSDSLRNMTKDGQPIEKDVVTTGMGLVWGAVLNQLPASPYLVLGPEVVGSDKLDIPSQVAKAMKPGQKPGDILEEADKDWGVPPHQKELKRMIELSANVMIDREYRSRFKLGADMMYKILSMTIAEVPASRGSDSGEWDRVVSQYLQSDSQKLQLESN